MKKIIIGFVVILLIAAAGAAVYLMQNLDGIVKNMVEEVGTETAMTQVRLKDVKVNLAEGSALLRGLTVANPPGYSSEPLLTLDTILVTIDTGSLTGPVYVIKGINIDGVHVLAEQKGTTTNIQTFMDGMEASEGSSEGGSTGADEPDIKLSIGQIDFSDATMELRSDQIESQSVELKTLQIRNVGTPQNGLTPDEAADEIADQMMDKIMDAVKGALSQYLRKEAESTIRSKLGSLFSKDKD